MHASAIGSPGGRNILNDEAESSSLPLSTPAAVDDVAARPTKGEVPLSEAAAAATSRTSTAATDSTQPDPDVMSPDALPNKWNLKIKVVQIAAFLTTEVPRPSQADVAPATSRRPSWSLQSPSQWPSAISQLSTLSPKLGLVDLNSIGIKEESADYSLLESGLFSSTPSMLENLPPLLSDQSPISMSPFHGIGASPRWANLHASPLERQSN